ncbi:MAG: SPOR domain-containing protein [Rhizobiales bacterium]|nr:SPOR domain-containing protein [Hyphomicrobiales bacterium]
MCFAYWRSPHGKRAALAVAVTLVGAFLLISTVDAEARSRKRQRPAGAWQAGFAAIVVDAKTGKILDEEKPDALRHPASLTKIMTLYLLFEQIEQGKLHLKSRLNVSEYASERPPSKLGVQEGTTIAVEDAIKALVTRSANDVATVIAENIADDEDAFAALMTRKARALGMTNTVFKNASGLPDREQVTTARDMATLGRAVQDRFPSLYRFFSTQSFVWRGRVIANHNRLLGRVTGVDGIKTGYTNASGFNLVTSIRHKNRHVVAVVLGGRTGASRDQYMRELISDNLDDATTGPRSAPLVAEAPAPQPQPQRVAQAPKPQPQAKAPQKSDERKPRTVRAVTVKQQPVVVAGSNQPIRPIPVKTMPLDAEGKIKEQTAAQANVLAFSSLGASNVVAVQITPNPGSQPIVVAEAPLEPQTPVQAPVQASITGALAYNETKPHPLAQSPQLRPEPQAAQTPPRELSETEELEIEAQAIAAAAKEDKLTPVAPKSTPRRPQVASTSRIPVSAPVAAPIADEEADPIPAAAKTGWSIQVGAFPNAKAAKERLNDAKESATALLAKVTPYTEKVSKDSTNLFRARFAGFKSEWHAKRTCQTLLRHKFDCIVAKN